MISAGKNIRSVDDALMKVKVEYFYHSIRNPRPEIEARIKQLRIIESLDHTQYVAQKRLLPYVVCGMFNPPYRRIENFAYTEYFILDIDHVTEKGIEMKELRKKVEADSRVVLSFLSPSEDGLKLMFKLKERCCDSGLYSVFYKTFAISFSQQYQLEQVIDSKTSDVARACFVSMDEAAYYNPSADTVDLNAFIDLSSPFDMFEQKRKNDRVEKKKEEMMEDKLPSDPGEETMARIKAILNPNAVKREKAKQPVYVPDILNDIISDLKNYIEQTGAVVKSVINIQYGKQITVQIGLKMGEVNLFYGKRGFSVIRSTKSSTDSQLNEIVGQLIETFINTYGQ
ncbi:MAG: virulence protein E [Paludibacteraceae bacterium]|nr:virulence protein E [Paludibacteraceae bacterium]